MLGGLNANKQLKIMHKNSRTLPSLWQQFDSIRRTKKSSRKVFVEINVLMKIEREKSSARIEAQKNKSRTFAIFHLMMKFKSNRKEWRNLPKFYKKKEHYLCILMLTHVLRFLPWFIVHLLCIHTNQSSNEIQNNERKSDRKSKQINFKRK